MNDFIWIHSRKKAVNVAIFVFLMIFATLNGILGDGASAKCGGTEL